jgi:GntR family transcriptional regulator / MocR family aminotransferase
LQGALACAFDGATVYVRRSRRQPLGTQLFEGLRRAIVEGELAAGARLPSTRDLAVAEGVARNTVLRVYAQLLDEGYVVGRHGAGTFVAAELPDEALALTRERIAPRPRHVAGGPVRLSRQGARLATTTPRWAPLGRRPAIDFRYGRPSPDDVPLRAWRRLLAHHARDVSSETLDYGESAGLPELREAIARHVARARAVACTPAQVIVVHGAQQALQLCAQVLVDGGDGVVVEEPGYAGATSVFRAAGARVLRGRVDGDGLDVAALARLARVRVVYVTPSHQFPTGVVMTLPRRLALLAWAERAGAWVVEDDYDSEFRFGGRPVESLQSLDRAGRVIYAGTFSKVLFPALRLGYLVAPEALVAPLTAAKALADTGAPGLEQRVLASFMGSGAFERHLRRARRRNGARRRALLDAVAAHLGERVEVLGANAGLHVMVRLRGVAPAREAAIVSRAAAAGVGVYSPASFYLAPERRPEAALLLGYAGLTPEQIRHGIARLARVLLDAQRARASATMPCSSTSATSSA